MEKRDYSNARRESKGEIERGGEREGFIISPVCDRHGCVVSRSSVSAILQDMLEGAISTSTGRTCKAQAVNRLKSLLTTAK